MALTILSDSELRRAVVSETDDGPVITYYQIAPGTHGSGWRFDRECCPKLPFHAACDLAVEVLNRRPPQLGGRM